MHPLSNKTILITGASTGIGADLVRHLNGLGVQLIISARSTEKLAALQSVFSGVIQIIPADLTNQEEIQLLADSVTNIDGWAHCTGKIQPYPTKFLKKKHIEDIFTVNFESAVLLFSQLMQKKKFNPSASLVFLSSISAEFPYMGGALYSASKAALTAYVKTIALENAPYLRANIIEPALVKTEMFEQTKASYKPEDFERFISHYPLGVGETSDISNAISFLLSPESKWITGSVLRMDGGLLLNSKRD